LGVSGLRAANLVLGILVIGISGHFTTEALRTQSKEFLIEKYSELGELCASVVR
jgi:hypothetical protein